MLKRQIKRALMLLPVAWHYAVARAIRRIAADSRHWTRQLDLTYERLGAPEQVLAGPFSGMKYIFDSFGSALLPKIAGTYEMELHAEVERLIARAPRVVIDIGAAEGYYAVGFAVRLPSSSIVAFEEARIGRFLLAQLCERNHVEKRVTLRGKCTVAALNAELSDAVNPLVICDCEGAEELLMDPVSVPKLRSASLVVETHDQFIPGVRERIENRFSPTHSIEAIESRPRDLSDLPVELRKYGKDALQTFAERTVRMTWLVMEPLASA